MYRLSIFFFLIFQFAFLDSAAGNIPEKIEMARTEFKSGNLQKALRSIDLILEAFGSADKTELFSDAYSLKGNILMNLERLEEAKDYHEKALAVRDRLLGQASLPSARSRANLGEIFLKKGLLISARKHFTESFRIYRKLNLSDSLKCRLTLLGLAKTEVAQGNLEEAEKRFKELQELLVRFDKENAVENISIQSARSDFFFKKRNFEEAAAAARFGKKLTSELLGSKHPYIPILTRQEAIAEFKNRNLTKAREILSEVIQNFDESFGFPMGNCYKTLGDVYFHFGDMQAAADHYRSALHFFKKHPYETAENLLSLADIDSYFGDQEIALEKLTECLDAVSDQPLLSIHRQAIEQKADFNFSNIFRKAGQFELALMYADAALKKAEQIPNSEEEIARCLLLKVGCLRASDQSEAAKVNLEQASKYLPKSKGLLQYVEQIEWGRLEETDGNFTKAITRFRNALEMVRATPETGGGFFYEEVQAYYFLSRATFQKALKTGNREHYEQALEYVEKGIEYLTALEGDFSNPDSEIDLREQFAAIFDVGISACFELNKNTSSYLEKGLQIAESFKMNQLRKLRFQGEFQNKYVLPEKGGIRRELVALRTQKFSLLQTGNGSKSSERLQFIDQKIAELQIQLLKSGYRKLETTDAAPERYNLSFYQASLRQDQTLLHFHRTRGEIFVFAINKNEKAFLSLGTTDEIETDIDRYFSLFKENPNSKEGLKEQHAKELVALSQKIYHSVIGKIKAEIELKENVLIIPDGLMTYLPFGTLIEKQGAAPIKYKTHQYLIEQYAFHYLQSFEDLMKSGNSEDDVLSLKNYLAVAPKDFPKKLSSLKFNINEARAIANFHGCDTLIAGNAREGIFKEIIGNYRVLHCSTHGYAENNQPEYSFLAFSREKQLSEEDGVLYVSEIYPLEVKADIVVLSSCLTARGELRRGEGLMSISRAFLYAGAKSVIASLWEADDKESPELISVFYENLNASVEKPEALRRAKITYLKDEFRDPKYAHPYFWGGFISNGSPKGIKIEQSSGWMKISVAGLVLMLFFLFKKSGFKNVSGG